MDRSLVIDHHRRTLKAVIDALQGRPYDLGAYKTEEFYAMSLSRQVLRLWRDETSRDEFVDYMVEAISNQLRRAWNEGMRENGLDPEADMTPEFEAALQDIMTSELDFVEPYADAIIEARGDEAAYQGLQGRVDLWAKRYSDTVNQAVLMTKPDQMLMWVLGATEQHCETCAALHETVASAVDWQESGYHPQGAPNPKLECGGWRCDCMLIPTEQKPTEGGIPNV